MFDVTVTGTDELSAALKSIATGIPKSVEDAVNATGLELRGEIVKGYSEGGKVGRIYQKYNPRRTHQASEEDQAPATDTGRLKNSVVFESMGPAEVVVSTNVLYGAWLEFGTQDIAPRPLWVPEAKKIQPKFVKRLEAALRDAMK